MHLIGVSGRVLESPIISCRDVMGGNMVECAIHVCSLSYKSLFSLPLFPFPKFSSTPSHYLFICAKNKGKIKINSKITFRNVQRNPCELSHNKDGTPGPS